MPLSLVRGRDAAGKPRGALTAHAPSGRSPRRTWSRADNWGQQPGRSNGERVGSLRIDGDATNDVTGVTMGKLVLANARLTGNAITLGGGGLESTGVSSLELPVQLSADQTWSVGQQVLTASGGLSGADAALAVALTFGSKMKLTGANEVGDVTVGGSEPRAPFTLGAGTTLNAASGKPVTVAGATLVSEGASVGALRTGDKATVQVGRPTVHPTGSLATTSATLSPGATVGFELGSGFNTEPGTNYGQLSSSGPIDLAGAQLQISHRAEPAGASPEFCENAYDDVGVGTVYTLVSTTGALTGRFANAPDGSTVDDSCGARTGRWTINYTANAVTATVASTLRSVGRPYVRPPALRARRSSGCARTVPRSSARHSPPATPTGWRTPTGGRTSRARSGGVNGPPRPSACSGRIAGAPVCLSRDH